MIAVRNGQDPPWIAAESWCGWIEPLPPQAERRRRSPGRRRLDDWEVLCGGMFVRHTAIRPIGAPARGTGPRIGHDLLVQANRAE